MRKAKLIARDHQRYFLINRSFDRMKMIRQGLLDGDVICLSIGEKKKEGKKKSCDNDTWRKQQ